MTRLPVTQVDSSFIFRLHSIGLQVLSTGILVMSIGHEWKKISKPPLSKKLPPYNTPPPPPSFQGKKINKPLK